MPSVYNKRTRAPRLSCKQVVQLVEAYIKYRSTAGVNVFAYINREVFNSIDRDISYDFKAATGGQYQRGDFQYLISKRGRRILRAVVALVEAIGEEDWEQTLDELELDSEAREDYLSVDIAQGVADRRHSAIRQYLKLVNRKESSTEPLDREHFNKHNGAKVSKKRPLFKTPTKAGSAASEPPLSARSFTKPKRGMTHHTEAEAATDAARQSAGAL